MSSTFVSLGVAQSPLLMDSHGSSPQLLSLTTTTTLHHPRFLTPLRTHLRTRLRTLSWTTPWTHSLDTQNSLDPYPTLPEHSRTLSSPSTDSFLTVPSRSPHSPRTDTPTSQTPWTLRTLRTRQTLDMVRWRLSTEEEQVAPLQK